MSNAPKQTRARQIRLRLRDPYLSNIEHFAKSAMLDLEDYMIMAALEFPFTLSKLNAVEAAKGTTDEAAGSVSTGTGPAGEEAVGG